MNNPKAVKDRNRILSERVAIMYNEGYSYREMAKELGRSHEWLRQLLKRRLSTLDNNSQKV